jgi:hypothetical protein
MTAKVFVPSIQNVRKRDHGQHRGTVRKSIFNTLLRPMTSATSGLALLWVGWVIVVFFVVLWWLTQDGASTSRQWQLTLILMGLGQCAISTGIGLAVVDALARSRRVPAPATRPLAAPVDGPTDVTTVGSSHSLTTRSDPKQTSARAAVLFSDGSIEVQTRVGPRRFKYPHDAIAFIGLDQQQHSRSTSRPH